MRIYITPGRYFEDVTEVVTPEIWFGFEFRVEQAGKPTKVYRMYMDDLEFLPEEARQRVCAAVAAEFGAMIERNRLAARHQNG